MSVSSADKGGGRIKSSTRASQRAKASSMRASSDAAHAAGLTPF